MASGRELYKPLFRGKLRILERRSHVMDQLFRLVPPSTPTAEDHTAFTTEKLLECAGRAALCLAA